MRLPDLSLHRTASWENCTINILWKRNTTPHPGILKPNEVFQSVVLSIIPSLQIQSIWGHHNPPPPPPPRLIKRHFFLYLYFLATPPPSNMRNFFEKVIIFFHETGNNLKCKQHVQQVLSIKCQKKWQSFVNPHSPLLTSTHPHHFQKKFLAPVLLSKPPTPKWAKNCAYGVLCVVCVFALIYLVFNKITTKFNKFFPGSWQTPSKITKLTWWDSAKFRIASPKSWFHYETNVGDITQFTIQLHKIHTLIQTALGKIMEKF